MLRDESPPVRRFVRRYCYQLRLAVAKNAQVIVATIALTTEPLTTTEITITGANDTDIRCYHVLGLRWIPIANGLTWLRGHCVSFVICSSSNVCWTGPKEMGAKFDICLGR